MRQTLELTCKKCDRVWKALVVVEYGITNFVNNSDAYCPECGMEAELPDNIKLQKLLKAS